MLIAQNVIRANQIDDMTKTNYQIGHDAEKEAAKLLELEGYQILALNWKNPTCEIDIITQRGDKVFFFEVKYRKTMSFGSGLEYITNKKLKQMSYAAELWVSKSNWQGDYQLGAISIDGKNTSLILLD